MAQAGGRGRLRGREDGRAATADGSLLEHQRLAPPRGRRGGHGRGRPRHLRGPGLAALGVPDRKSQVVQCRVASRCKAGGLAQIHKSGRRRGRQGLGRAVVRRPSGRDRAREGQGPLQRVVFAVGLLVPAGRRRSTTVVVSNGRLATIESGRRRGDAQRRGKSPVVRGSRERVGGYESPSGARGARHDGAPLVRSVFRVHL